MHCFYATFRPPIGSYRKSDLVRCSHTCLLYYRSKCFVISIHASRSIGFPKYSHVCGDCDRHTHDIEQQNTGDCKKKSKFQWSNAEVFSISYKYILISKMKCRLWMKIHNPVVQWFPNYVS